MIKAASAGTIVIMGDASSKCNPATRAWCIYEWASTLAHHTADGLHLSVHPDIRAKLVRELDVGKAECCYEADKQMILDKVKAEHGSTANFNQKLKLQLMLQPLSYRADLARLQKHASGASECLRRAKEWLLDGAGSRCLCLLGGAGGAAERGHQLAVALGGGGGEAGDGGGG